MTDSSDDSTIYLWAAAGGPSELPGRQAVRICPQCGALVAVEATTPHARWHRQLHDHSTDR